MDARSRDRLAEVLHERVCEHCIDHAPDHSCHTHDPKGCAVLRHLPELVELVHRLRRREARPYFDLVQMRVCAHCENAEEEGENCPLRSSIDCGLYRYLPLILETIEDWERRPTS